MNYAELLDLALRDIQHVCETCAHYCKHECEDNCRECAKSHICRSCNHFNNWLWRGFTNNNHTEG